MPRWIRAWWQKEKPLADAATDRGSEPVITPAEAVDRAAYSSDQPIGGKSEDRFNRWPFAKRIAETVARSPDPSSLVIGIYGPWGDGKTSTLVLLEEALKGDSRIVVLRFNPWLFGSEQQLVRAFFNSLADKLERSLSNKRENVGRLLKKYGGIVSVASVDIAHSINFDPGKGLSALGEALSSVELSDLRLRLEQILEESGKRVVVLIDDIDRLDRSEIHAMFKLVKLSASFSHTSYVLAFDDEMVAAALGERYGGGGAIAGKSFLEKIVQVSLHLPPAEEVALRTFVFGLVDSALTVSAIQLTREQVERFARYFIDSLSSQMRTPRQAKRFANALSFSLPLLRGEVEPVDLMLIEGTRIFYPKLYAAIRDNSNLFLSSHDQGTRDSAPGGPRKLVDTALRESGVTDTDLVWKRLIEPLFPRASRTGYGDEWDTQWAKEQRICSSRYFKRYFSYSVPPGDVGDLEILKLVSEFQGKQIEQDEITNRFQRFADRQAIPVLISKLRSIETSIDISAAGRLALAVARNGRLLPKEEGPLSFGGTILQGAVLVSQLIRRFPPDERERLALDVIHQAEPLPFMGDCLIWMRQSKDKPEENRLLSEKEEGRLGMAAASRIRDAASHGPFYRSYTEDAPRLLWLWKEGRGSDEMESTLREWLNASAEEVDLFLEAFVRRAWGLESGLSHRSDFRRDAYNQLAELINPNFILSKLRERYGSALDEEKDETPSNEAEFHRRTARQFLAIHKFILEAGKTGTGAPADNADGKRDDSDSQ